MQVRWSTLLTCLADPPYPPRTPAHLSEFMAQALSSVNSALELQWNHAAAQSLLGLLFEDLNSPEKVGLHPPASTAVWVAYCEYPGSLHTSNCSMIDPPL